MLDPLHLRDLLGAKCVHSLTSPWNGVELAEGVHARTNGVGCILMDKWLLQVERR